MNLLVTGGAGYIGSHTCVELLHQNTAVTVLDNLENGSELALQRVQGLAGRSLRFVHGDIRHREALRAVFADSTFDAVIHFAGLKAVGESVAKPLAYYQTNVGGTLTLLEEMERAEVRTIVFSSSATVYGDPQQLPIREDAAVGATNPYGRSKLMVEQLLGDFHQSKPEWKIARLRYFNPVGAHPSGEIGEDPQGIPNNLMPFVSQVAVGARECLSVFGNDYPTADGTGVRDYIHVVDLAQGHLAALNYLFRCEQGELLTVNLGTGRGHSVLEVVEAFERASGRRVPYRIVARRPGDVAACWADPSHARERLGWQARLTLDDMCRDSWRWQSGNPRGYCV